MQGVGNDFVVVDIEALGVDEDLERLAIRVCDRKFGIGADGLLVAHRPGFPGPVPPSFVADDLRTEPPALTMRMFNPDGTEDMCGNGLRCVGLWALRHGWLPSADFCVMTKEGPRDVRVISVDDGCRSATLGVDMGRPKFDAEDIPFDDGKSQRVKELSLTVDDRVFTVTAVNTGSTHTVVFGPEPSETDFRRYSPLIENHPYFPQRTSVLWSTLVEAAEGGTRPLQVKTRIWERGAGETLGCGTGACAVAVAAKQQGLANDRQVVQVISRGGTLAIGWSGVDSSIDMVGPASLVYEGETVVDHR